jgi:glycosyltransferase involved in cell wall biosynthesis
MKLCFLGDIRSTHVQKFVKWFTPAHETHIISFNYKNDPRTQTGVEFFRDIDTQIHLVKNWNPYPVRETILRINPDILQCHFLTHYGFLGAFSRKHPLVMSAMGDDILLHPSRPLLGLAVRYALLKADAEFCDGQNSLEAMATLGVPETKQHLIYPGIDMDLFNPGKKIITPCQTVFFPRGFDEVYDPMTTLEAIQLIHDELPHTRFQLLGSGSELEQFKTVLYKRNLVKWVWFLGNIPNRELPLYYASASVSVNTSLSDGGIPTSTIEAMACGTPVVSTDAGDALLWIGNKHGYVVGKGDSQAIADSVVSLLCNEEIRESMGSDARRYVESRWGYAGEMRKIERLYASLLFKG